MNKPCNVRLVALVLLVESMGAHILPICTLYIQCRALIATFDCTVCTVCTLEYNPVLCTQMLVSLCSTINTEPKQIVSINLAGVVTGGRGAAIQAWVSCSSTVCQP